MAYIGKEPSFGAFEKDIFTGDGSTTQFTLTHTVASATSIIVSLGGVIPVSYTHLTLPTSKSV